MRFILKKGYLDLMNLYSNNVLYIYNKYRISLSKFQKIKNFSTFVTEFATILKQH